jgi:hypothetical protein
MAMTPSQIFAKAFSLLGQCRPEDYSSGLFHFPNKGGLLISHITLTSIHKIYLRKGWDLK